MRLIFYIYFLTFIIPDLVAQPTKLLTALDSCECLMSVDTIFVTSTDDSGIGSLRCAINCANEYDDFTHIRFDLSPNSDSTISLLSPLPTLQGAISIVNPDSIGKINLDGSLLLKDGDYGLRIVGDDIELTGLRIVDFPNNGIDNYQGHKSILIKNNIIENGGRLSEFGDGIDFRQAENCVFLQNRIIGNNKDGIYLQACKNIRILGNQILENNKNGINIYLSDSIFIGDSCQNCGNLISGNKLNGIRALEDVSRLYVYSNFIGINQQVENAYPNEKNGIEIIHSDSIFIGDTNRPNYISGNLERGILLSDSCSFVRIQNNYIGLSIFEGFGIANGMSGVEILESRDVLIGGDTPDVANHIGFNPSNIYIGDSSLFCSVMHNAYSCSVNGVFIEPGSNEDIAPPENFSIDNAVTVLGINDPKSTIQAYKHNPACTTCFGIDFIGSTYTSTGAWQIILPEFLEDGDVISLSITDSLGNSSAFSNCMTFSCDAFFVQINPQDSFLCLGNQLVLSTDTGDLFNWSTGATSPSISISSGGNYQVTVLNEKGCPGTASVFIDEYPSPELSLFPEDSSFFCNESILLKAEGQGFFQWNNGNTEPIMEVYGSGNYCVSLTNFYNCMVSDCVTVIKGKTVNGEIEVLGDSIVCEGERVDMAVSGGTEYFWSTGEYNLDTISVYQSGFYTVTITNEDGCQAYVTQQIVVNPGVNALVSPNGFINLCHGDSVTLTASGGTMFRWSTGEKEASIIVDELGVYFVTIENEYGCSGATVQTVSVKPPINARIENDGQNQICADDRILLSAGGDSADSLIWSTGETTDTIQVDSSGIYRLEVFKFGCNVVDSVEITVFPLPKIDSIYGPTWSNPDSVKGFYLGETTTNSSYYWNVTGGAILSGNTGNEIEVLWGSDDDWGEVCVMELDSNNCQSPERCRIIDLAPLQSKEIGEIYSGLVVYPNPAMEKLHMDYYPERINEETFITVYSSYGSLVYNTSILPITKKHQLNIDIKQWPTGVYIVKFTDRNGLIASKRILVSH